MTDLLEDRLRSCLSAVADSTSIPAVPQPDSLAVVRPIRRRIVVGTAGVGIAAAVTALAVVMSGGTDLAGPRAGLPQAPTPLSSLRASAAANCARGVASARAVQQQLASIHPGQAEQIYNDTGVDPRLAADVLYVAPEAAVAPLSSISVDRICDPAMSEVASTSVRAVVRLGADGHTVVAAASVTHPAATDGTAPPVTSAITDATVQGVVAHTGTVDNAAAGIRDVWWTGANGIRWVVRTSGLNAQAAVAFAEDLVLDGTAAAVTAPGWDDVTVATRPLPTDDYSMTATYGPPGQSTYVVTTGHDDNGIDPVGLAQFPEELVRVRSSQALVTRFPNDSIAEIGWEPSPGISINVRAGVPAGASIAALVAFADSLRLVGPGDPALVPVPMTSVSAAASLPASPSDFAPGAGSASAGSGFFSPTP